MEFVSERTFTTFFHYFLNNCVFYKGILYKILTAWMEGAGVQRQKINTIYFSNIISSPILALALPSK